MNLTVQIRVLREKTGAPVIECKNALLETGGNEDKAVELLLKRGLARAEKKLHREVSQGLVEAYIHPGSRIGALVEVNCESDFVARTQEFRDLAHDLALQIAATAPTFLSPQEVPPNDNTDPKEVCLLCQPFIKDPQRSVEERIKETIARVGENIRVKRFARFELGV
jgi:elongation factor Ts